LIILEAKGYHLEIIFLDRVDSTHIYLKELIQRNGYINPLAVVTQNQLQGVGSRGEAWIGKNGNLFFSFVVSDKYLPKDLPLQSASIYFSFLLKQALSSYGSQVWVKWPNDFYVNNKKIGGTITNASGDLLYCGIGLNLIEVHDDFGKLDIKIDIKELLEIYFKQLEEKISWKQIFSEFEIEFQKSKKYKSTIGNEKVTLENAKLVNDGSIIINDKKVFSLR